MSQAIVRCYECPTDHGGPRSWKWWCEECATECQTKHRRETGHSPELAVVPDASMESLTFQICEAAYMSQRGW